MVKINKSAFTLIELLAVIVILGILMLVAIPAVTRYIDQSRRQTFVSSVNNLVDDVKYGIVSGHYSFGDSSLLAVPLSEVPEAKGANTIGTGYLVVTKTNDEYLYHLSGVSSKDGKYKIYSADASGSIDVDDVIADNSITIINNIKSDGSQNIDTGVKTSKTYVDPNTNQQTIVDNNDMLFSIKYRWVELPTEYRTVFSNSTGDDNVNIVRLSKSTDLLTTKVAYNNISEHSNFNADRNTTTVYEEIITADKCTVKYGNNNSYSTKVKRDNIGIANTNNITLLSDTSNYNFSSIVLYYFRIYDSGALIRDFVPCKNSNGIIGLCDMVHNGQFYDNSRSGGNLFTEYQSN